MIYLNISTIQMFSRNKKHSEKIMMKRYQQVTLAVFVSCFSTQVVSQEHHYWSKQFGSRSALMSGAVVGGVRDTSAGFYNPGALGFIKASTFSASGNGYQLESVDISNGVGTGEDVDSLETNIVPLLISGTVMLGNNTLGYSILAKNQSSIKMSGRHEKSAFDILSSNPDYFVGIDPSTDEPIFGGRFDGTEEYKGQFTYDSKVNEIWGGLSWAHLLHENISVGISGFLALRKQSFNVVQFARVTNPESKWIASEDAFQNADFYNVRGLLKFGLAGDFGALKVGATLTTPSVSFFGTGTVAGGYGQFKEDEARGILADDHQDDLDAKYKTPLSLALGLEYAINQKTSVAGTIEWFAKQKSYDVITPNSKNWLVGGGEMFLDTQELKVEDKADSVVNFAVAVEQVFINKITGYLSFSTDFSSFPGGSYNSMGINDWDIYHLTVGLTRQNKASSFALGFTYSFGSQDDFERLAYINPTDRRGDDYILAMNDEGKASADYRAFGIIVGYTYFFK